MRTFSPQEILIQWLSAGDRAFAELLRQCVITLDSQILIDCPHLTTRRQIQRKPELLAIAAKRLQKPKITLRCPNADDIKFTPEMIFQQLSNYFSTIEIPPLGLTLPGHTLGDAIAIVRMSDHKGLYCSNEIERHSRAKVNDWTGENMSRFHIPEELQRFTGALITHGYLDEFQYRALTFEGQPIEMTVSAFLGTYQGDLCRVVQVINSELI